MVSIAAAQRVVRALEAVDASIAGIDVKRWPLENFEPLCNLMHAVLELGIALDANPSRFEARKWGADADCGWIVPRTLALHLLQRLEVDAVDGVHGGLAVDVDREAECTR